MQYEHSILFERKLMSVGKWSTGGLDSTGKDHLGKIYCIFIVLMGVDEPERTIKTEGERANLRFVLCSCSCVWSAPHSVSCMSDRNKRLALRVLAP